MFGRKYPLIVLSLSLVSVLCLLIAERRFFDLALAYGWNMGSNWILWALLPGIFCLIVWSFQKKDWLQLAGVVSTAGVLVYSFLYLGFAMTTEAVNGHSVFLGVQGVFGVVVTLAWSVVALLIGRLGAKREI